VVAALVEVAPALELAALAVTPASVTPEVPVVVEISTTFVGPHAPRASGNVQDRAITRMETMRSPLEAIPRKLSMLPIGSLRW
jgi:hypothetical protein